MFKLIARTIQFTVFHTLVTTVDRINRLPRKSDPPEVVRILRDNLALKAQVRALVLELKAEKGKRPKVSLATRAAQVFAYLLTRGCLIPPKSTRIIPDRIPGIGGENREISVSHRVGDILVRGRISKGDVVVIW